MAGVGGETIDALGVAGYLVAHSGEASGASISNLKLQKLVYYAQGFALAFRGEPLFREPLEAWDKGPVVREIHRQYRDGARPIAPPAGFNPARYLPEDSELLDALLRTYGQLSAGRLCGMTHAEPPWVEAYNNGRNTPIALPTMHAYFSELVGANCRGETISGHPIFPVAGLQHQRRRELGDRMERHREKLRAIASRPRAGGDPWADDED